MSILVRRGILSRLAGGVIGWLLSLYIAGRGVDRFGPRRMVQIGLPLAGLAVLLAAVPALGLSQAPVLCDVGSCNDCCLCSGDNHSKQLVSQSASAGAGR